MSLIVVGRANPKTGKRRLLRKIATELARIGEALIGTGTPGAQEAARAYFARGTASPTAPRASERSWRCQVSGGNPRRQVPRRSCP
jgi:hypothetical protein